MKNNKNRFLDVGPGCVNFTKPAGNYFTVQTGFQTNLWIKEFHSFHSCCRSPGWQWVARPLREAFFGRRRRSHLWGGPGVNWRGRCLLRDAGGGRAFSPWTDWTWITWRRRTTHTRGCHWQQTRKSRYHSRDSRSVTWGRSRFRSPRKREEEEEGWEK